MRVLPARWGRALLFVSPAIFVYALTSLIVLLGVQFGRHFLQPPAYSAYRPGPDLLSSFAGWDGIWYQKILTQGYAYDPEKPSGVAFFPAYPLLGRAIVDVTGCRPDLALVVLSHIFLAGSLILLLAYTRRRFPAAGPELAGYVVLAAALWPTTFFFRMAYTESLFLFLTILVLYGMERRWPLPVLAGLIGLTTATRVVGLALLPVLVLFLWQRSPPGWALIWRLALWVPIACWGLAAYAVYQYVSLGEPLAFAQTQANWTTRPPVPFTDKVLDLATLEPLWSVYDPSTPCFWKRHPAASQLLFDLQAANPVYFLVAVALVLAGAWKRWLSPAELVLASGLLLIPYLTRSHEMCMAGMGRFAAVAFPTYLVLASISTEPSSTIIRWIFGRRFPGKS